MAVATVLLYLASYMPAACDTLVLVLGFHTPVLHTYIEDMQIQLYVQYMMYVFG